MFSGTTDGFFIGNSGIYSRIFRPAGKDNCPLIILFHGLPGNETNLDIAYALREKGYAVLAPNYNGCWGSLGSYRLQNIPGNVKTILEYVFSASFLKTWGIDPERTGVVGHSIGGWASLITPKIDKRIKAIAALAPVIDFDNIKISAQKLAPEFIIPLRNITVEQLIEGWVWAGKEWSPFDTVNKMVDQSLMLAAATEDEILFPEDCLKLYNQIKTAGNDAELWVLHTDHSFVSEREKLRSLVIDYMLRKLPTQLYR